MAEDITKDQTEDPNEKTDVAVPIKKRVRKKSTKKKAARKKVVKKKVTAVARVAAKKATATPEKSQPEQGRSSLGGEVVESESKDAARSKNLENSGIATGKSVNLLPDSNRRTALNEQVQKKLEDMEKMPSVSSQAQASSSPGGKPMGFWPKVIVWIIVVVAGFMYIRTLAQQEKISSAADSSVSAPGTEHRVAEDMPKNLQPPAEDSGQRTAIGNAMSVITGYVMSDEPAEQEVAAVPETVAPIAENTQRIQTEVAVARDPVPDVPVPVQEAPVQGEVAQAADIDMGAPDAVAVEDAEVGTVPATDAGSTERLSPKTVDAAIPVTLGTVTKTESNDTGSPEATDPATSAVPTASGMAESTPIQPSAIPEHINHSSFKEMFGYDRTRLPQLPAAQDKFRKPADPVGTRESFKRPQRMMRRPSSPAGSRRAYAPQNAMPDRRRYPASGEYWGYADDRYPYGAYPGRGYSPEDSYGYGRGFAPPTGYYQRGYEPGYTYGYDRFQPKYQQSYAPGYYRGYPQAHPGEQYPYYRDYIRYR